MMTNGKYVSVYNIIEKAYRDLGLKDQINLSDAVEWAGEAVELIGAPFNFKEKVAAIPISNYRGKLPADLHYIFGTKGTVGTIEDCKKIDLSSYTPMRYSTDSFHHYYCRNNNDSLCNSDITYKVNDDFMFTNFEEGQVLIAYKAIPTDDNGFPLIPDDIKFRNAVAYHIMWKRAFIDWSSGKMRDAVYNKIEQDRDWYIGAAQTRANMPSVDMLESLKNNFIRLIPKINQHKDGFKGAGHEEERYTHNSTITGRDSGQGSASADNTFFHYKDSAD